MNISYKNREEIIRDDYATKCNKQLILSEELINTKNRMKISIISLLSDSNYHIRVKALKCMKIILNKEISSNSVLVFLYKDIF